MSILDLLINFFFSFLATVGFSIFFNSPKKSLLPAGIIGAIGWTVYLTLQKTLFYLISLLPH